MTDKEIFIAAHEKAYPGSKEEVWEIFFKFRGCTIKTYNYITSAVITSIIFSHSFAKTFWGEDRYYHINEGTIDGFTEEDELTLEFIKNEDEEHLINNKSSYHWYQPKWQYHLQQLILCEKPLKYIEQFLKKGETD